MNDGIETPCFTSAYELSLRGTENGRKARLAFWMGLTRSDLK